MSHARVRGLLNKVVAEYSARTGYAVDWENRRVTDKNVFPRLEIYLMPALSVSATLDGDLEEIVGVYQITVVTQKGSSSGSSDAIIEDLHKAFPIYGLHKDDSGFSFQTTTPLHPAEGRSDGDTWRVPCWFNYQAVTNAKEIKTQKRT